MANKECILVADDAAIDRRIVRMLLRKDYEVEEAADGLEAVKRMEEAPERYACLLLDMFMPVMDGFHVMSYMHEHGLLEKIPVIALTAISDAEGHIKCYESGAIDLIEKPFDQRMLQYKIKFDISRFRRLQGAEAMCAGTAASAAEPTRSSLLDAVRTHVRAGLGVTDEAEMKDFIDTFLQSFTECADELRALTSPPDCQIIRQVTHKIYGFAFSVGAVELNDMALLLSAAAKQADAKACEAGIRQILRLYGECAAEASGDGEAG